jgi:hypothetical protein
MMDIPPRHNANGHTWHHPNCQLVETVLNGSGAMGDMMRQMMGAGENLPRMPAFKGALTEEDVQAVLAYIKTWWTEDQQEFQAAITKEACEERPTPGLPWLERPKTTAWFVWPNRKEAP